MQPMTGFAYRIALVAVAGLLPAILTGCATLSEGECNTADWFAIGRHDGGNGQARSRLYDHRKACAEYGISPDSTAYSAGRNAGLARYCTPRNGFNEGREGKTYRNVCPVNSEPGFLAEYRRGTAIHEVEEEIKTVERAIVRRESQLDDDDTTAKQADALREALRRDYDELRYRNRELIRLERLSGNGRL